MRSPADRSRLELALRIVAFTALALWIVLAARPRAGRTDVAGGASLPGALERWTATDPVDSAHVRLETAPDARTLAWLAALRASGTGVSWSGTSLAPIALETWAASEPAGGVVMLASAPGSRVRVFEDALGPIDTVHGSRGPVHVASVEGGIVFAADRQRARADIPDHRVPRRVLVVGAAGWEAKFVVAALEESGWTVDAHLFVAPGRDVWQGQAGRAGIDTGRYSAVVLLDSAGAESAGAVERFVREGGGVVLAGDANRASRVSQLVTWRSTRRELAPLGTLAGDTAWRGLARIPLEATRPAIALERRNGASVVLARRHHAGRVVAVGYDQTWRWRMASETSLIEHRGWWSRIVASVAHRPHVIPSTFAALSAGSARDLHFGSAPLATLNEALGAPTNPPRALAALIPPGVLANILAALFLVSLLAEWLLRRARGAR